ncbi:MAG TPA: hypothetical protein VMX77_00815 [Candidatus Bathyarchaeia archaeon]|nr:hypothetical protein [Candidatus Bathyarchaeia archaeon]
MRRRKHLALIFKSALLVLFLSLLIPFSLFLLKSDFLAIKRVTCFVDDLACPGDYWTNLLGFSLGKNFFVFPAGEAEEKMMAAFPDIEKATISKVFPDQIKMVVKLRKPVAAIAYQEDFKQETATFSAEFLIVDEKGIIFQKTGSPLGLPVILTDYLERGDLGQKVDYHPVCQSVDLVILLSKLGLKPESVRVSGQEIQLQFEGDLEVFFSSEKEASVQVGSLQLILSRTKIEGKRLKRVDLRFDKPVIVNN